MPLDGGRKEGLISLLSSLVCENASQRLLSLKRLEELAESTGPRKVSKYLIPFALSLINAPAEVVAAIGDFLGVATRYVQPRSAMAGFFISFFEDCDCDIGRDAGVKAALNMDANEVVEVLETLLASKWYNEIISGIRLFKRCFTTMPYEQCKAALVASVNFTKHSSVLVVREAASLERDIFGAETVILSAYKASLFDILKKENDDVAGTVTKNLISFIRSDPADGDVLDALINIIENCTERSSMKPRYHISLNLPTVMKAMITQKLPDDKFTSLVLNLMWDACPEVRQTTISSVIKIYETEQDNGLVFNSNEVPKLIFMELVKQMETLAADMNYYVKKTLASELDGVIKIGLTLLKEESEANNFITIVVKALKMLLDEQSKIAIKSLGCVLRLNQRYEIAGDGELFGRIITVIKYYISCEEFDLKVAAAKYFEQLTFLDYKTFKSNLFPVYDGMFSGFAIIADIAVSMVVKLYNVYGIEFLQDIIPDEFNVRVLLYKRRIIVLKLLMEMFMNKFNESDDVETMETVKFHDILTILSSDPISNVRVAVGEMVRRIVVVLEGREDTQIYSKYFGPLNELLTKLREDTNSEVRSSATL